jgi:hypothetical protein
MRVVKAGSVSLVALLVAACGGGGGGGTEASAVLGTTQTAPAPAPAPGAAPAPAPGAAPAPAPGASPAPAPAPAPVTNEASAGAWNGVTSTNRGISGVVLNDGTYYLFYSAAGVVESLGGFLQGTGSSATGTFVSPDTKDFNLEGPSLLDATLSATFTPRSAFNGSVSYPGAGGTGTFTTSFDADYDIKPSLASIAGTYTGQSAETLTSVTMTVTGAGAISGSSSGGCTFTGSAAPRAVGNVYDITLRFGAAPCDLVGATLTGIALYDGTIRQLLAVGLNGSRSQGFIFLGSKPTASAGLDAKSVPARGAGFSRTASGEPFVVFSRP